MSQFYDFDVPKTVVAATSPQPKTNASEVTEHFPASTTLVAELRDLCPELFADAKVLYMAEDGREIKTRTYRAIESMQSIDAGQWLALGELSKRLNAQASKGRR